MKKPIVTRIYKFADAVLKQKADEIFGLLDRDRVEFADRGYDEVAKDAFADAIRVVENQTIDETLKSSKMTFTEIKDASRSVLEKSMRTIFNMAANKFGSKSAKYTSFGKADISNQSDSQLVRTFKVMAIAARENLAELASEGLTQEKIDRLNNEGTALDVNIDAAAKGVTDRDIATEKRVEGVNPLYGLDIK